MSFQHKILAGGRWQELSLKEQLGNIGGEVSRAIKWRRRDTDAFERTVFRALELFDLTLGDPRWRHRLKEIARAREMFCDAISGGKEYGNMLEDIDRYLFQFALAARISR